MDEDHQFLDAYLAGLFDGEGSVSVVQGRQSRFGSVKAVITNTDREILEYLQQHYGGKIRKTGSSRDHGRIQECWSLVWSTNSGLADVIPAMLPFTRVKAAALQAALAFLETVGTPGGCRARGDGVLSLQDWSKRYHSYRVLQETNHSGQAAR